MVIDNASGISFNFFSLLVLMLKATSKNTLALEQIKRSFSLYFFSHFISLGPTLVNEWEVVFRISYVGFHSLLAVYIIKESTSKSNAQLRSGL